MLTPEYDIGTRRRKPVDSSKRGAFQGTKEVVEADL